MSSPAPRARKPVSAMAENADDDLNSNLLHAPYLTGDPQLDTAIGQWLRWDKVGTWSPRHLSPLPAHPLTVLPFRYPPRVLQAPGEMAPASTGLVELGDASHLPMQGLLLSGGLGWAGTTAVAFFCGRQHRSPASSPATPSLLVPIISHCQKYFIFILIFVSYTRCTMYPSPFLFLP